MKKGRVSLVGAGPGDQELITKKGLDCIKNADVIIYDNLIPPSLINEAKLEAELIYAGKRSSNHHLKQDETNSLLVDRALSGKYVVRLKGGDPFIFGRGAEEAIQLKKNGIDYEYVPGISSAYSVPGYAGIPVTERDVASSFHVITGHERKGKDEDALDYSVLAKEEGTLVFLMGLNNLGRISSELIKNGKISKTPVAVISSGTTVKQKVCTGDLESITFIAEKAGMKTPAITVVGDVVALREDIEWIMSGIIEKPLFGKRVLLTGTRNMVDKLSPLLKEQGAEAVAISLIETVVKQSPEFKKAMLLISKISDTVENKNELGYEKPYTWIVFTSRNGVDTFFSQLKGIVDLRQLSNVKFAVIGQGSRDALSAHGFMADFVPTVFTSRTMTSEWVPMLNNKDKILLVRAEESSEILPEKLKAQDIDYTEASIYETKRDIRRNDELIRMISECDYITVASSSAVTAISDIIEDKSKLKGKVVSIGPVTTETCIKCGIDVLTTASEYTSQGIIKAIVDISCEL